MAEFSIINNYFAPLGFTSKYVALDIGDDAAILNIPEGYSLVTAGDTLIEDVHFPADFPAYDMAYRSLATNLSDLAAMGAEPIAYLLQICFDQNDDDWLSSFSAGLKAAADGIPLIGGDTTKSAKTVISITTYGIIEEGKALKRSTAQVDDDIYVTGVLGQGAQGLADYYQHQTTTDAAQHFQTPQIPLAFAQALAENSEVHACIDISDGLDGDVKHILNASWVGATIQLDALPLNELPVFDLAAFNRAVNEKTDDDIGAEADAEGAKNTENAEKIASEKNKTLPNEPGSYSSSDPSSDSAIENTANPGLVLENYWKQALFGGDDYQLCFTAAPEQSYALSLLAEEHGIRLSKIGTITQQTAVVYTWHNEPISLDGSSYSHFD